jgi:hypothetical protein
MLSEIKVRSYGGAERDKREIRRYAGASADFSDLDPLIDECISEIKGRELGKVCYCEFAISRKDGRLDLGFAVTSSSDLAKNLDLCESIVLFGASIGIEIDRLISKYSRVSPVKALIFQAIGTEQIERLCDEFSRDIAKEKAPKGKTCRPRFSPGYGDLPIEMQKDIFKALDCQRKIGLTLNASMLMSPTKSVSAIIGVK